MNLIRLHPYININVTRKNIKLNFDLQLVPVGLYTKLLKNTRVIV